MEADQIDALLVEVQTLAKLNHPNIVRYFHAWIEYKAQDAQSVSQSFTDPEPGDHRMLPEPNTRATGTDYGSNVNSEIGTQNLTSEYGGHHGFSQVFDPASGQERYDDNVVFGYSSVHHSQSQHVDSSRVRRASHATTASNMTFQTSVHSIAEGEEDDPEVENIPRTVEEIGVSLSKADLSAMRVGIEMSSQSDYFEQDITLLIKMSLHPMTLSKYLSVDKSEDSHDMDLRHCFHEDSSLSILGAILDGLDYLHSQNIIHRDIKPANIFLSIHEDKPPALKGCVNVRGCSGCSHLDRTKRIYVTPCIGDFGLTAELKPPVKNSESDQEVPVFEPSRLSGLQQKPVGTLFYRPRSMPNKEPIICPKLDVYSLGVIALEMIQKFGTKSERATVISALKQGILPTELEDHVMAEGILSMVCEDRDERWDCLNVRKWLEGLQRKGMGEGKEAL
jgi:translation initiation factor 2-alpha kinase 3